MPIGTEKSRDKPQWDAPPPVMEDSASVRYRVACWVGFHDFELLQIDEMPKVEIHIVPSIDLQVELVNPDFLLLHLP